MDQSAHNESGYKILAAVVAAIVIGTGLQFVPMQNTESALHVASVAAIPATTAPAVVNPADSGLSDRAVEVSGVLEGRWTGVENATVYVFAPEGVLEIQEGEKSTSGIWGVFTADMTEGEAGLPDGVTYLQTTVDGVTSTFQVGSVSGVLQLVDIANGQVVHFQKI